MENTVAPARMKFNIRRGDRVVFVGTTGCGKTTAARALLAKQKDVVAVDPKQELKIPGAVILTNPHDVIEWRGPGPLIYRPVMRDMKNNLGWLYQWIWQRQHTILYIDELFMVSKSTELPAGLEQLIRLGRSKEIGVWSATQRPARIPIPILSESEHSFTFRLRHPADLKRMAEYTDKAVESDPARDHDFWYYGDREQTLFKTDMSKVFIK